MKVKAEFVVEGVGLAALSARQFADDSLFLYQAKRLKSAAVNAVIAIENVGRARRMLGQILKSRIDPATGQFPVKADIDREKFLDSIRSRHEAEIRSGIVSLQFAATSPVDMSQFNKYASDADKFPSGTPEHAEALERLTKAVMKMFNKTTTGFHLTRTIQQYVEPDDECTVWNEPQDATEQRVRDLVVNAINNYNFLVSQITGNKQMMAILQQKGIADQLTGLSFPNLSSSQPETQKT
jgi:hypothetical protein